MPLLGVFDIGGSGMHAQSVRLNTTASNLANVDSAASTEAAAYRALQPVFESKPVDQSLGPDQMGYAVSVSDLVKSAHPVRSEYRPDHPLADEKGYVFFSNVNVVEEMANMISASRAYQSNAEVINTAKEMMLKTITLLG